MAYKFLAHGTGLLCADMSYRPRFLSPVYSTVTNTPVDLRGWRGCLILTGLLESRDAKTASLPKSVYALNLF